MNAILTPRPTNANPGAPYAKPLPLIEPEAQPYWEALKAHTMKIQRCAECATWYFPPRTLCPSCLSDNVEWTRVSGRGTVYAATAFHHAFDPAYEGEVPYNVSIVQLEEGPRLVSNVIGITPEEVQIGQSVEVVYEDVTEKITLAKFTPVRD